MKMDVRGMGFSFPNLRSRKIPALALVAVLVSAHSIAYTYSQRHYVALGTSTIPAQGLGSNFSCTCLGSTPRNIVLLIGDGMGYSHIYATHFVYRALDIATQFNAIGITFISAQDNVVPDSADAGTVLAIGFKTLNRMISMIEVNSREITITTVLELAKRLGMPVGAVTKTRVTYAISAVFT